MVEESKDTLIDYVKTFTLTILIVVLVKLFIVDVTRVSGESMNNTLWTDDLLLVDKIGTNFTDYKKGQVVIVKAPDDPKKLYVKRIIAEPKDTVDLIDGSFYINGEKLEEDYTNITYTYPDPEVRVDHWELKEDEYFIVGDNRTKGLSHDSRAFGPVNIKNFIGHAKIRIYPLEKIEDLDVTKLELKEEKTSSFSIS